MYVLPLGRYTFLDISTYLAAWQYIYVNICVKMLFKYNYLLGIVVLYSMCIYVCTYGLHGSNICKYMYMHSIQTTTKMVRQRKTLPELYKPYLCKLMAFIDGAKWVLRVEEGNMLLSPPKVPCWMFAKPLERRRQKKASKSMQPTICSMNCTGAGFLVRDTPTIDSICLARRFNDNMQLNWTSLTRNSESRRNSMPWTCRN